MNNLLNAFIRIGVTGHRVIPNEQIIREKIKEILFDLDKLLKNTPYNLIAVSPLAEGADRIVTEEILAWRNDNFLEVILPMDENEYLKDFETLESKNEFKNLISQAISVQTLDNTESRNESYYNVGKAVVHNCNILIAIWDGAPAAGRGGTENIVNYAREYGRNLFWVDSNTYEIKKEVNTDNAFKKLKKINDYNLTSL